MGKKNEIVVRERLEAAYDSAALANADKALTSDPRIIAFFDNATFEDIGASKKSARLYRRRLDSVVKAYTLTADPALKDLNRDADSVFDPVRRSKKLKTDGDAIELAISAIREIVGKLKQGEYGLAPQ